MEDAEAMAQVRDGRVERLAVVFERHHLYLFNYFLGQTRQRGASEDLVQEVFLRLLRYRASYRPGAPFAPWLWQIARNVHRDHVATQRPSQPLDEVHESMSDGQDGAEVHLMRTQDTTRLQSALARLDPAKRDLLLLSRNPDLPYKDLAQLLGCSVGALKVQVHRALKELRTVYLELHGGLP